MVHQRNALLALVGFVPTILVNGLGIGQTSNARLPFVRGRVPSTSLCRSSLTRSSTSTDDTDQENVQKEPVSQNKTSVVSQDHDITKDVNPSGALTSLLSIAAASGRGEFATSQQKDNAMEYIRTLESSSKDDDSYAASPSMLGTWELVYSNTQLFRSSPFFMAGRAVCATPQQAEQYDWFCDMHRAALAISTIGAVRQLVSETRLVSEFEVKVGAVPFLSDFSPFSYSGGLPITIEGAIVSSADITPMGNVWEIFMDTVEIKGSNLPLLRKLLDGGLKLGSRDLGSFLERNLPDYSNPRPVFETTYLSDSIRISRDQDGKVFVYAKVSDSTEPTDYKGALPDLGIGTLLEGFNDAVAKSYL